MRRLPRLLLALVLAVGAATAGAAWWFERWLDQPGPLSETTLVLLPRGEGLARIAARLQEAGAVADARLLLLAGWWTGDAPALKAGEYAIAPHESPRAILAQIAMGRVFQRKFTVPEGLSSAEILALLGKAEAMSGDLPAALPPEGSLLPETYNYLHGDTRADMLRRMARARDDLLQRLWASRDPALPYADMAQAVIMASIVEAETPKAEERPVVAGVFVNRLRRGMKLQTDPTVVYGITQGLRELGRPLSRADLAQPTPWNTYTIDGLPPTPINHPGRASLTAALAPASTKFLYFVADGSGGHLFAETYDQHLRNVALYRAQQK